MIPRLNESDLDTRIAERDDPAVRECLAQAHVRAQARRFADPLPAPLDPYDVEREWRLWPLYVFAVIAGAVGPFLVDWLKS